MQRKVNLKNILLTIGISIGLVLGVYIIYNINTDIDELNIESVNKIENSKVENNRDQDVDDRNSTVVTRENEEKREQRIATIVNNIRGEYRGIRSQPLRYSPIEVYKPPITNNKPIELPSITNKPSIPNVPSIPSVPNLPINPITPNIPTTPNPSVIPPDTDDVDDGINPPLNTATGIIDKDFYTGNFGFELISDSNRYIIDIDNFLESELIQSTVFELQSDGNILVNTINSDYINNIFRINQNGDIDESFNSGDISCCVFDIKEQSDGKILVGGDFNEYLGESTNGIVRLNSDGSRDTSFNIGTGFRGSLDGTTAGDDSVNTLAIQEDGKIIVGGNFTSYNGVGANRIIRLNSDGSRDTSFNIGTGFSGIDRSVYKLVVQSDGKILIGGNFTSYNGLGANKIIRLNSDGSRDSSFDMGSGFGDWFGGGVVNSILLQTDGKILVGGDFRTYQNNSVNRLIRLTSNGEKDLSFNSDISLPSINTYFYIQDIYEQSDGTIFILFRNFSGEIEDFGGNILKLNSDGSRDTSFSLDMNSLLTPNIADRMLLVNNTIFLGGALFTTVNNVYNADGELIDMQTIDFENEEWISNFNTDGGAIDVTIGSILKFNLDGSRSTDFDSGLSLRIKYTNKISFDSDVDIVKTQSDGKIIVGGGFSNYKGESANGIIRLNSDGSRDNSFEIGTGFDGTVNTIAIQSDGKIVVGGDFSNYKGASANSIIRLNSNGSRDNSFEIGTGFDGTVNTIAIQSDGKIVVGGYFNLYQGELEYNEEYDYTEMIDQGGSSANGIIRLNSDGSRDDSFEIGTGFNETVNTIAIQSDGKIIVGGDFSNYKGASANSIIRLNSNGSRDNSFEIGTGFDGTVNTIAIQSDGKIVVGGYFNLYQGELEYNEEYDYTEIIDQGGSSANGIIRLNNDGSRDDSFEIGTGFNETVNTIAIQSDGKIVVGGGFELYQGELEYNEEYDYTEIIDQGGASANRIIRLNSNGSRDNSFEIGTGFNETVNTIAIQSDGKIVVGGRFQVYNNQSGTYLLRLK
jgi:uncharacterized delta-60 repeat protein